MFFLLIFSQDRLMTLFQWNFQLLCFCKPPRLLTLEIFANIPVYCTLPFIILAEICQPPRLFGSPILFETLAPKGDFSGKIDFHHLCLSSKFHHPTKFQTNPYSWSLDIRSHDFNPNWVQIAHLPQKRFFGKIDCYYCLPTVLFHASTFQKILK